MARKEMTPREHILCALEREIPDRLPVTIHQWQPNHLNTYMGGVNDIEAFHSVRLGAAITSWDANEGKTTATWQVESYTTQIDQETWRIDHTIATPEGMLTQRDEANDKTTWIVDFLIKQPEDLLLGKKYLPVPRLKKEVVTYTKGMLGESGILRSLVFGEQAESVKSIV